MTADGTTSSDEPTAAECEALALQLGITYDPRDGCDAPARHLLGTCLPVRMACAMRPETTTTRRARESVTTSTFQSRRGVR